MNTYQNRKRLWEILPGLLTWNVILFPLWGAYFWPKGVAYFVIAFLCYWFYRSFKSSFLILRGYRIIKKTSAVDWQKKYTEEYKKGWLKWKKVQHTIIICSYKEPIGVIDKLMQSLAAQQQIDLNALNVVLAQEARAGEVNNQATEDFFRQKYEGVFGRLVFTEHPFGLPTETIGKHSNEAWAAKEFKKLIFDSKTENIDNFTLTSTDVDTVFNKHYFAALTYHFCKNQKRYERFWQSPLFWHLNIEEVPAPIRIVGIVGSMIHIADIQEPDGLLFNYSCYSSSYKLIDSVGYWDLDVIPEDWHIFLQSFFKTKGEVEVEPIFVPTLVGAPSGKNSLEAMKNRYKQVIRHAWGATDIAYAIEKSIEHKEITWLKKLPRIYKLFKTHLIWSSNWFILTLGASLPALLNKSFFQTTIGYNLPKFSRTIMTLCLIPLLLIVFTDWKLRPKEARPKGIWAVVRNVIQWPLMPIATLFMAVLPGLDSHTRLMMGKRIEYRTTVKK